MIYSLFIDDERYPPADGRLWLVARTQDDAKQLIAAEGWPQYISFDHDLGDGQPSGKDFANWIIEQDLDNDVLPSNFAFYVHSQNPVGAHNIDGLLSQYLKFKKETT